MNKLQRVTCLVLVFFVLLLADSISWADESIKIGSAPNLWFAEPAVIIGEGWDKESGFRLDLKRYPGPANLLQAFAGEEIQGMNNNIGAAILAKSRGIALKLTTGTFLGDINLLGDKETLELKNKFGAIQAIKNFNSLHKRKLILVTNPRGSLSDLTARYWLKTNIPDYLNYITLIHAGDQAQLQQIFINQRADLMAGFAPLKQIVRTKRFSVDYFLKPEELMVNQPGGALVLRTSYIETHSELVDKLKELYLRATEFMKSDPKISAKHIKRFLLQDLLEEKVIEEVLIERRDFLSTDLSKVKDNTREIYNLMLKEGYLKNQFDLDEIFK